MDRTQVRKEHKKAAYTTPKLRPIELITEEVLGSGCKSVSVAGPGDDGTCLASGCSEMAS